MSRKNSNSLREFQARLTDRLKTASTQKTVSAHLGVQIGEDRFLVELADAGEIVPVPAITTVPLTQDWFKGIANLRGVLYSVSDFARYMGFGTTPIDRDSRLLALGSRLNFNASILVSKMLGLRNVQQMQIEQDERAMNGILGATYRDAEGFIWRELRLTQLSQDERFLLVGR